MRLDVRTIGQRARKGPITPAQREQIDSRFRELQRIDPKTGAYARLRKGGITTAVIHGRGTREWGRYLQRRRGPAAIRNSPVYSERCRQRVPLAVNAHLLVSGAKRLKAGIPLTPCQAAARAGDWRKARPGGPMVAKPTDALLRDRLQVKTDKQKFETSIQKSGEHIAGRVVQTRVGAGDRFTKTNRNTKW